MHAGSEAEHCRDRLVSIARNQVMNADERYRKGRSSSRKCPTLSAPAWMAATKPRQIAADRMSDYLGVPNLAYGLAKRILLVQSQACFGRTLSWIQSLRMCSEGDLEVRWDTGLRRSRDCGLGSGIPSKRRVLCVEDAAEGILLRPSSTTPTPHEPRQDTCD